VNARTKSAFLPVLEPIGARYLGLMFCVYTLLSSSFYPLFSFKAVLTTFSKTFDQAFSSFLRSLHKVAEARTEEEQRRREKEQRRREEEQCRRQEAEERAKQEQRERNKEQRRR